MLQIQNVSGATQGLGCAIPATLMKRVIQKFCRRRGYLERIRMRASCES